MTKLITEARVLEVSLMPYSAPEFGVHPIQFVDVETDEELDED